MRLQAIIHNEIRRLEDQLEMNKRALKHCEHAEEQDFRLKLRAIHVQLDELRHNLSLVEH